jgi:hypothetical protein
LYLVINISICHWMWQGKMWETSLWTCAPFSKAIVVIIFRNVSWVVVCLVPQRHQSKWVPRLSMVWPHWHYEKWAAIECDNWRHVCNVVRKWVRDNWNACVVGWFNNQTPTLRVAHEWTCVRIISERSFNKSKENSYSCKWFTKEAYNWG